MNPTNCIILEIDGLRFVWHGGTYVDVERHRKTVDIINVWNYKAGCPRFPFTVLGLATAIAEHTVDNN